MEEIIYVCKGCGAWRKKDQSYWVARREITPPAEFVIKTHCDTCKVNPKITICMDCQSWSEYGSGVWMRATPAPEDAVASHGLCHVCRDKREKDVADFLTGDGEGVG
jgi:hypothetical protein